MLGSFDGGYNSYYDLFGLLEKLCSTELGLAEHFSLMLMMNEVKVLVVAVNAGLKLEIGSNLEQKRHSITK
jgi:hypothetical protein